MIEILDYCFRRGIFRVTNSRFESVGTWKLYRRSFPSIPKPVRTRGLKSLVSASIFESFKKCFSRWLKSYFQIFSLCKYNLLTAAGRMGNSWIRIDFWPQIRFHRSHHAAGCQLQHLASHKVLLSWMLEYSKIQLLWRNVSRHNL